jgi:hypothetical protein
MVMRREILAMVANDPKPDSSLLESRIDQFCPGGRAKERGVTHVYRSWDHRSHRGHRTYHSFAAEALIGRPASITLESVKLAWAPPRRSP